MRLQNWAVALSGLLLFAVAPAHGACPNKCSGHGRCGINDVCECMQNYQGGDCSERVCPFTRAWHDTPMADDDAHYYAECGNRGSCDRDKGVCSCDDGFTGSGCRRLACPADCSGHGTCQFIEDLAIDTYHKSVGGVAGRKYTLWDQEKIMGCVCDPGFEGHDCSLRMCPRGDDPLTPNQYDMSQVVVVSGIGAGTTPGTSATGYLTYFDPYGKAYTTDTITFNYDTTSATSKSDSATANCAALQVALRKLPNNVLNTVTVAAITSGSYFTFARASPDQDTGTTTTATAADTVCQISFTSGPGSTGYQQLFDCNFVKHNAVGMHPVTTGPTQTDTVTCTVLESVSAASLTSRPLTELAPCSGRGTCDQSTGLCKCFAGHMGLACQKQEALV